MNAVIYKSRKNFLKYIDQLSDCKEVFNQESIFSFYNMEANTQVKEISYLQESECETVGLGK